MLGEPWFYWAIFAVAILLWVAVPIVDRWERRQDRRDQETWERIRSGLRP